MVLLWALATTGCGARSDASGPLDHDALTTRDGGVAEQVAVIDVGDNIRPNPGVDSPAPEPDVVPTPQVPSPDPLFEPEPIPMAEPAVDAAGNVYIPYANEHGVFVAGTPDLGRTWWEPVRLADRGGDDDLDRERMTS